MIFSKNDLFSPGEQGDFKNKNDHYPDTYSYPDENDALTAKMISQHEYSDESSWDQEEKIVLNRLRQVIIESIGDKDASLIDFGCGEARLITEFEPLFSKITGIEPDKKRYDNAISNSIFPESKDILLINCPIEATEYHESADVVILSHVIQHIEPQKVQEIIKKASQSLKQGGIFYLATNISSDKEKDEYTKMYFDSELHEDKISADEFSSLIQNDEGILPIHWFSRTSLQALLDNVGFHIIKANTLHGSPGNTDRDIAIIARKSSDNKE